MGEAAGTAAHLSLAAGARCPDISIAELQSLLRRGGVFLGDDPHAL
jgi:hypothetical protein